MTGLIKRKQAFKGGLIPKGFAKSQTKKYLEQKTGST